MKDFLKRMNKKQPRQIKEAYGMPDEVEAQVKTAIDNYIAKNGDSFEIYTDYRDELSKQSIAKIFESTTPADTFYDIIGDFDWWESADYEYEYIFNNDLDLPEEIKEEYSTEIFDMLRDYISYQIPYDHFNRTVGFDIFLNNPEDANIEYGAELITYNEDDSVKGVSGEISKLLQLQGHTEEEFVNYLNQKQSSNEFFDSLINEIENCTYDSGNQFVFLVQAPILDMAIAIQDHKTITIPMNAMCGLFEASNGSGSVLDVKLEKDITGAITDMTKPSYQARDGVFEVFYKDGYRYNVDDVYGLVSSAWDADVRFGSNESLDEISDKTYLKKQQRSENMNIKEAIMKSERIIAKGRVNEYLSGVEFNFYNGDSVRWSAHLSRKDAEYFGVPLDLVSKEELIFRAPKITVWVDDEDFATIENPGVIVTDKFSILQGDDGEHWPKIYGNDEVFYPMSYSNIIEVEVILAHDVAEEETFKAKFIPNDEFKKMLKKAEQALMTDDYDESLDEISDKTAFKANKQRAKNWRDSGYARGKELDKLNKSDKLMDKRTARKGVSTEQAIDNLVNIGFDKLSAYKPHVAKSAKGVLNRAVDKGLAVPYDFGRGKGKYRTNLHQDDVALGLIDDEETRNIANRYLKKQRNENMNIKEAISKSERLLNESLVKTYKVTLKHDDGKINITTTASSEEQAIKQVCGAENAPESAVISVKELKKRVNEAKWDNFAGHSLPNGDKDDRPMEVVFKKEDDDVLALFPKTRFGNSKTIPGYVLHSTLELKDYSRERINSLKNATATEYSALKKELESMGYTLVVINENINIKEAIMKSERLLNEGEYISYNELRDYFKNDKTVSNWLDRDLGGFILYDNTLYIESNNYIPKAVIRGAKKYAKEKGYIWSGDIGWVYESKINEISDLSANLLNKLRYTDLQLKNAEDNAVYREFGDEASDKKTHPAFKKALDKYKKNSKLLAKRNRRKGVNEDTMYDSKYDKGVYLRGNEFTEYLVYDRSEGITRYFTDKQRALNYYNRKKKHFPNLHIAQINNTFDDNRGWVDSKPIDLK